jgi:carboxylate-amine ligase
MRSAIHPRLVAAGVEEEFHIVDLATRGLTGQANRLMGRLPADRFSWEMQRSVLEANSRPWVGLTELAEDIAALRQAAIAAAEPLGLGIVAAGTVPLADPGTLQVTPDPRYEHIQGEYRMLVREQLICSTQVHVDVITATWPWP